MKLIPIALLAFALFVGGCNRKQDAQTKASAADPSAQAKTTAPTDVVETVVRDFTRHMRGPDTLYLAFGDQDPPADLLQRVQEEEIVLLPASRKAATSERTTFILYPDKATVSDSVVLDVKWQARDKGGTGKAVAARRDSGTVVTWDWKAQ